MLTVYVYDTKAGEIEAFMKLTNKISEEFNSKPKSFPLLLFAGVMINPHPLGYVLEQNKYSDKIDKLPSDCDFNLFRTTC